MACVIITSRSNGHDIRSLKSNVLTRARHMGRSSMVGRGFRGYNPDNTDGTTGWVDIECFERRLTSSEGVDKDWERPTEVCSVDCSISDGLRLLTLLHRKHAQMILDVRGHPNWLLVSLILASVMVAEGLPLILSHEFKPGSWAAFSVSTVCVAVIGEIIPQAVMPMFILEIAGRFMWFVKGVMYLMAIPSSGFAYALRLFKRWKKKGQPYRMDGILDVDELIEFVRLHEKGELLGGKLEDGAGMLIRMMMVQQEEVKPWRSATILYDDPEATPTMLQRYQFPRIESNTIAHNVLSTTIVGSSERDSNGTTGGIRRRPNWSSEAYPTIETPAWIRYSQWGNQSIGRAVSPVPPQASEPPGHKVTQALTPRPPPYEEPASLPGEFNGSTPHRASDGPSDQVVESPDPITFPKGFGSESIQRASQALHCNGSAGLSLSTSGYTSRPRRSVLSHFFQDQPELDSISRRKED